MARGSLYSARLRSNPPIPFLFFCCYLSALPLCQQPLDHEQGCNTPLMGLKATPSATRADKSLTF